MSPLQPNFFQAPALSLAENLVRERILLCRRLPKTGEVVALPVTEAEAYTGPEDKACHAYQRRTPRNAVMFGPPGVWYVYLCYGVHWLLNIVVERDGFPAAVLIRGAGETHGPGRLTKRLQIARELNNQPAKPETGLWLAKPEDERPPLPTPEVVATPRIGIDGAGPEWALKPFRFVTGPEARKKVRSKWLEK